MKAQHKRTKNLTVRWSETEFAELGELAKRAGTTQAAILRAAVAALKEKESPLPPWGELRELRNAVIEFTSQVRSHRYYPKTEAAAINALDRISRF